MINKIHQYNVSNIPWPLDDNSVDCCVTSPPYWALRNYGVAGQIGMEETPELYVQALVTVFEEVRRVLKPTGTCWINLGDTYYGGKGTNGASKAYLNNNNALNKKALIATSPGEIRPNDRKIEGLKPKDLVGIPWMIAFALRSAGWYLRQDIIWHKPNPMPESVSDRCTKAHEYIFLLSKSKQYYYDQGAILEPMTASSVNRLSQDIANQNGSDRAHGGQKHNGPMKACQPKGNRKTFRGGGKYTNNQSFDNSTIVDNVSVGNKINETQLRNKRSVWSVATMPFPSAHFATFPEDLIVPCVKAGCPEGGTVLDCFMGAGTTALVARKLNRNFIGFELNPEYITIAENRLKKELGMFQ